MMLQVEMEKRTKRLEEKRTQENGDTHTKCVQHQHYHWRHKSVSPRWVDCQLSKHLSDVSSML